MIPQKDNIKEVVSTLQLGFATGYENKDYVTILKGNYDSKLQFEKTV